MSTVYSQNLDKAERYLEEGKDESKIGGDSHRATNMLLGSIAAALIALAAK